jgi:hypothetical protein
MPVPTYDELKRALQIIEAGDFGGRRITRAAAKLRGLKTYFTGQPCINGHVDDRAVSNGNCMTCVKLKARRYSHKKRTGRKRLND